MVYHYSIKFESRSKSEVKWFHSSPLWGLTKKFLLWSVPTVLVQKVRLGESIRTDALQKRNDFSTFRSAPEWRSEREWWGRYQESG